MTVEFLDTISSMAYCGLSIWAAVRYWSWKLATAASVAAMIQTVTSELDGDSSLFIVLPALGAGFWMIAAFLRESQFQGESE